MAKSEFVPGFMLPRSDKRTEARLRTKAYPLRIHGDCQSIYGYVRDISPNGMQIRTFSLCSSVPKAVGEKIKISLRTDEGSELSFTAEVRWNGLPMYTDDAVNIQGVKFDDSDPTIKRNLNTLLPVL